MSWRRQLGAAALRSLRGGAASSSGPSTSSYGTWLESCCSSAASSSGRTAASSLRGSAHRQPWAAPRRFATQPGAPEPPSGTSSSSTGRASPITFRSMFLALFAGAGVVAAARHFETQKTQDLAQRTQAVVGKAAVGGPFALIDQDRRPFTDKDLNGEFSLLYFGFTHCPDICPDELEKLAEAVDAVERDIGAAILPVFISVDPMRDTPERVKQYVREFHPRMVGLTGDEDSVKAMTKAYRVYFHKSSEGSSPDDYLVDHSIIMYLLDPQGEFVTFYGKNFDAKQLTDSISGHIKDWEADHSGYRAQADAVTAKRAEERVEDRAQSSGGDGGGRRWYWPFGGGRGQSKQSAGQGAAA